MIGQAKSQLSILDSAFNRRKKRSRIDKLLTQIDNIVDWKRLEREVEPMFKKSKRGRPTIPIIYSLKCLVLQYLYDLSDPQLEDYLIDRLSFQRFLGISFEEEVPDFTTIWRFRERMIKANLLDKVFNLILEMLDERNFILKRWTIVDATIVQSARKPKKKEKKQEEEGACKEEEKKNSQQDNDARFTKKGKKTYYGYKGHIGIDEGSGIIRKVTYTPANVHDSKELENLISGDERSIFADKAYDSSDIKRECRANGIYYGIIEKAHRNRPLSSKQKKNNKKKSKIRSAVERTFAHFKSRYGLSRARYVTLERNEFHFKMLCSIYNIRRGLAFSMG